MRQYGVLLHISSLPSAWGIGDLGPAAHDFARNLAAAGASVWQFLPLNPTSTFIGNSPYSSLSAFAGNPLFISPELLVQDGYLSAADLDTALCCIGGGLCAEQDRVDYDAVTMHRNHLLRAAFERSCPKLQHDDCFTAFCNEHSYWLHDYARFVTLKEAHCGASWVAWPEPLKLRQPEALAEWDCRAGQAILREKFIQYLFFSQWMRLRTACNETGVSLLADVPIYVTHDSVDVWSNPHLFNLDADMQPITVSGVPPDYFSETGQRWGTPVYDWARMQQEDFGWWKRRLGHTLLLADMARLDHFRGFCGYWEIPAEEETAINGVWKDAPASALFRSLQHHFGGLPFLAEDLGVITDDVREAMADFNLPGMHVLQFAFGGREFYKNSAIAHLHTPRSFVYTGTHDNPPTRTWFQQAGSEERDNFAAYAGQEVNASTATTALCRIAFASVADVAVLPMQDVLQLGDRGRMNKPGVAKGNWTWRMTPEEAGQERLHWLQTLARTYGRLPEKDTEQE